jgi:uncharacterized protein YgiB involved in biofilm formation
VKRSVAVGLTLAAGAVASWYVIAPGTSQGEVKGQLYTDADACSADARFSRDECLSAFVGAAEKHQQTAPRYATKADCEADFTGSACEPLHQTVAGAAPAFIPAMAGVVIAAGVAGAAATAIAATGPTAMPVYRSCQPAPDPRYCRSSSYWSGGAFFYTSSGYRVTSGGTGSNVSLARASFTATPSTRTLSRGGFGMRAAGFGHGHG